MPSGGNLHISKPLTNVAVEYKNNAYIADDLFGVVTVNKETDLYYTFNRDFRIPDTRRANGAKSNRWTWGVSTSSYVLERLSLHDIVTDRDRENSDSIQLDNQSTEGLVDKIQARVEVLANNLLMTTTSWGGNTTIVSTTSWRYYTTGSVPVQNWFSASTWIANNSGKRPNSAVTNNYVYDLLRLHPDITSRIQYVERAIAGKDLLASVLDIDQGRFFVGEGMADTGLEGVAESLTSIWSSDFWMGYLEQSPGMKKISAAYMFAHSHDGKTYRVKKWRDEDVEGDKIEVNAFRRPIAVATACAYLFKAVGV